MRNLIKITVLTSASLTLSLLMSCGGGGFAGIDGSGSKPQINVSASGPINGFGSVIVNGVRYNTDDANVYIRGQLGEEMSLNVGDYVVVVGEINSEGEGVAKEVHYQPRVTGLVESLDLNLNRLTVLGQTVQLMEDTTYASDILPRNVEGFEVGQRVTVSGISDADDLIRASRIELNGEAPFEVLGAVESIDRTAKTFKIDKVKVDYGDVWGADDRLREGKMVAVWGDEFTAEKALNAVGINFDMDIRQLKGIDSVELTGFVKNRQTNGFNIDSLPITYSSQTEFKGGTQEDLDDNVKVRVKGALGSEDSLVAAEVEILPSPDMQVYGEVQSIVPASWGSPFWGKVQVQDHIFWIKFDTRLTGDQEQRISFMDVRAGDTVYVSGYSWEGNLYATSLAVDNRQYDEFTYDMQGFVYGVVPHDGAFSIFNTRIATDDNTIFSDGFNMYTRETFFTILTTHYVHVRGYFDFEHGVMRAKRVTLQIPWMPPVY